MTGLRAGHSDTGPLDHGALHLRSSGTVKREDGESSTSLPVLLETRTEALRATGTRHSANTGGAALD